VAIESGARVSGWRIVDPVIIGARSNVTGSYICPFTAMAEDCAIDDSEMEYSLVRLARQRSAEL
jgi:glucose-1-phosphate thymidylyltransferase